MLAPTGLAVDQNSEQFQVALLPLVRLVDRNKEFPFLLQYGAVIVQLACRDHYYQTLIWVNLGLGHKITRSIKITLVEQSQNIFTTNFSLEGIMDAQKFLGLFKEVLARTFPPSKY